MDHAGTLSWGGRSISDLFECGSVCLVGWPSPSLTPSVLYAGPGARARSSFHISREIICTGGEWDDCPCAHKCRGEGSRRRWGGGGYSEISSCPRSLLTLPG